MILMARRKNQKRDVFQTQRDLSLSSLCHVRGRVSLPVCHQLPEGRSSVLNGGIPSTRHRGRRRAGQQTLQERLDNLHRGALDKANIEAKGSQRLGVEWVSSVPRGPSDHSKALTASVLFITGTERGSSRSRHRREERCGGESQGAFPPSGILSLRHFLENQDGGS